MTTVPLATDFQRTGLWRSAFTPPAGEVPDSLAARSRARFAAAFLDLRARAVVLADEIKIALPTFTVHGPTHLDALWELASRIAGKGITLTPPEGYVLGGAFMLHDLGMTVAAYPDTEATLQSGPIWGDALAATLRQRLGRFPTAAEIADPSEETRQRATAALIRERHAVRAEELGLMSFPSGGTDYYLIEDADFREQLGPAIGRVAASHWWPLDRVRATFPQPVGAPSWLEGVDPSWDIDSLKLACLLRTADACHIDALRSPGFLMALRRPGGDAAEHWTFQRRMTKPHVRHHRFVFTASNAFSRAEEGAWWQCYEALRIADGELRDVDSLQTDLPSSKPFDVRGVAGAESPERLAQYVATSGWEPADTRLRASSIARVVQHLGGRELYGPDLSVPLRELVQNAADAIRARRFLELLDDQWGTITIRTGVTTAGTPPLPDAEWIEIEDDGLGMSHRVLTGPLLDLGASYWGSSLIQREWPGLLSSGFLPTGRFGIGFFSVFIWGDEVSVTSRPYTAGRDATRVLEFGGGPAKRPLLRSALSTELVRDGGTRVRATFPIGTLDRIRKEHGGGAPWSLKDLLAWLCPALDANLDIEDGGVRHRIVTANDWRIMDGEQLLARLLGPTLAAAPGVVGALRQLGPNLRQLTDAQGGIVGRACLTPLDPPNPIPIVVTAGGLRASTFRGMAGVVAGEPERAARDLATPAITTDELAPWASGQAGLIPALVTDDGQRAVLAARVRACGGLTGLLPIARASGGWLSAPLLTAWAAPQSELLLVAREDVPNTFPPEPDTLAVPLTCPWFDDSTGRKVGWPSGIPTSVASRSTLPWWRDHARPLFGAVLESVAAAWGATVDRVLRASELDITGADLVRVGRHEFDALAAATVHRLRRPPV